MYIYKYIQLKFLHFFQATGSGQTDEAENIDIHPIEELSCFNKKYVRKYYKINNKYQHPTDLYDHINNGLYNQIFQKDGYDHLQIE